jgi:arylsulfatase A-like enzyme
MLQDQGYETAFIGKWHLGWDWGMSTDDDKGEGWNPKDFENIDFSKPITNNPNDLGFTYAYGHSGSLDMAPYVYVENGQSTAIPNTVTVDTGKYSWWREGPTSADFVHDEVTPNFFQRGINYINEKAGGDKPFFLYLPLPSPHTPILPTEKWKGKSGLSDYADFMLMIDDYMGKLLDKVDEKGIAENTLIIFTSDNGCSPAAGIKEMQDLDHFPSFVYRGHKADIFEGGHRVPFLAKWPKQIKAGSTSDQTICLTDLMATFSKISGHELQDSEGEDSYDITPILNGSQTDQPLREATIHHSINGSFALRKDQWKLIMCPGSGGWSAPRPAKAKADESLPDIQLYDLSEDAGEKTNLVDANPDKVKELRALLISYIENGRSTPGEPQQNDKIEKEWKQIGFVSE